MSQGNGDNSWYKYLESLEGTSTSSNLGKRDLIEKIVGRNFPQLEVCLLSYECSICMKHMLEVRVENCEHEFCAKCVPRNNCPEECKPWLIHSLSAEDLKFQQDIINEFKSSLGFKVVKVQRPKKKRKEPGSDDDETSE